MSLDQGSTHHRGNAVDQGVVNAAAWDVNDAVSPGFKEADLGRTDSSAYGQTGPKPKSFSRSGFDLNGRQSMRTRQLIERAASGRRDSKLAKTWAARAGRTMRTGDHSTD